MYKLCISSKNHRYLSNFVHTTHNAYLLSYSTREISEESCTHFLIVFISSPFFKHSNVGFGADSYNIATFHGMPLYEELVSFLLSLSCTEYRVRNDMKEKSKGAFMCKNHHYHIVIKTFFVYVSSFCVMCHLAFHWESSQRKLEQYDEKNPTQQEIVCRHCIH